MISAKSQLKIVKISDKHPLLANLVKPILCVPVTSATVERVLSHGGIIVRFHRSSLAPQKLHKNLFLKCSEHVFATECIRIVLNSLWNEVFIFVFHDQLIAKNAHRSWIHGIQKIVLHIFKKLSKCLLF